jgi:hypothetical protein
MRVKSAGVSESPRPNMMIASAIGRPTETGAESMRTSGAGASTTPSAASVPIAAAHVNNLSRCRFGYERAGS